MPFIPSPEEKLKGLDNLYYEIQQLLYTTLPIVGDRIVCNAMLESRLLHVRALLDVFAYEKREKDDVLAAHFGFPVTPIAIDQVYADRLNKDLAHLTYSRTRRDVESKGWPIPDVVVPVLRRCVEFIEHVLANRELFHKYNASDWRQLAEEIGQFLESPRARQDV